jgi:two-component system response regulator YesN
LNLDNYWLAGFNGHDIHGDEKPLSTIAMAVEEYAASFVFRSADMILWLYNAADMTEAKIRGIHAELHNIINSVDRHGSPVVMGCSGPFSTGLSGLPNAISLVRAGLDRAFYEPTHFIWQDPAAQVPADEYIDYTPCLSEIETHLLNREFSPARSTLTSLLAQLRTRGCRPLNLKEMAIQVCYLCNRALYNKQLPTPQLDIPEQINACEDMSSLENVVYSMFDLTAAVLKKHDKPLSQIVEKAVAYVSEHYAENISLELVAGIIPTTPSHLSRIFKKEYGQSFTDYLNQMRIERAKTLLYHTNMLSYEIGQAVGLKDPAYFSVIFKKYTGLSPKEFKHRHETGTEL